MSKEMNGRMSNLPTDENVSVLSTQRLYSDNSEIFVGKPKPLKPVPSGQIPAKSDGDQYE